MPTSSFTCGSCCCPGCRLLIAVYNCNGITDDDFTLTLNGTLIATMPEDDFSCGTPPSLCRGHLVVPTGWTTKPVPTRCGCTGTDRWETITTSSLLDNPGCDLTFVLTSTKDNHCGNFGHFLVYRACGAVGTDTGQLKLIYSADYNMPPLGSNTYVVNNGDECCNSSSSSDSSSSSNSSDSSSGSSSPSCPDVPTLFATYTCTGCDCANGSTITLTEITTGNWVNGTGGPCGCDGPVFAVTCVGGAWTWTSCSGFASGTGIVLSTDPLQVLCGPFTQQQCGGTCSVLVTSAMMMTTPGELDLLLMRSPPLDAVKDWRPSRNVVREKVTAERVRANLAALRDSQRAKLQKVRENQKDCGCNKGR